MSRQSSAVYPTSMTDLLGVSTYEDNTEKSFTTDRQYDDRLSSSPVSTLDDGDSQSAFGVDLTGKNSLVGKSFTIAAILGLTSAGGQDVMNLSMQERLAQENSQRELQNYFCRHEQRLSEGYCRSAGLRQEGSRQPELRGGGGAVTPGQLKSRTGHPLSCSNSSSGRNKRIRTIFTPEQLERLEAEFERQQYMVGPERLYLAHALQLTEAQVKVWFQNRRIKWRKHHLEVTQQRLAVLQRHRTDDIDDDV